MVNKTNNRNKESKGREGRYISKEARKNENKYKNAKEIIEKKPTGYRKSFENNEAKEVREDIAEGRNAVIEILKGHSTVEQILVAKGDTTGSISVITALAKEKGIVIKEVDRKKLDSMSVTGAHQGVIAQVTPFKYCEIEDILEYADKKGEEPFIVILDEIEDPHNFGSIVRTAEACGVHGIIIPKRRNVGVTPTVYKSSAGAVEHMMISKVTNINSAIDKLKAKGIWIYGAHMEGSKYSYNVDFSGGAALIIGSEGRGISKLSKEKCDVLIKIPMVGKISSLNASVAGGILMYEILKQKITREVK